MLLALAAGKAASSITSFVFFLQDDVFVYLLNGIVDGSWSARPSSSGRSPAGSARRASLKAPPGLRAAELRTLRAIAEALAPGEDGLPAAEAQVPVAEPWLGSCRACRPEPFSSCGWRSAFEWLPSRGGSAG